MSTRRRAEPAQYPFVPKSNARLRPGDFWAVPLRDGSFACGRVIELPPHGRPGGRVSFLGALLDWHDARPPTSAAIAGVKCVRQGAMHILAISTMGGVVLGNRALELDGIEPWLFLDCWYVKTQPQHSQQASVQSGYETLRVATSADANLPLWSAWGYGFIRDLAETRFLSSG
jgi:hypothetical protein